jgi:hypothetical protein
MTVLEKATNTKNSRNVLQLHFELKLTGAEGVKTSKIISSKSLRNNFIENLLKSTLGRSEC